MIIDEDHVLKTIVSVVKDEMAFRENTADARRRICARLKMHPLVDDAVDVTWPFGGPDDGDLIQLKVKIDGSPYKTFNLRVTKSRV